MKNHTRRRLASLTVAAGMLTAGAAAAPSASAETSPHGDLAGSYTSLSAAMIGLYAHNSGQSLTQYLDQQKVLLAPYQAAERQQPARGGSATPTVPVPGPAGAPTAPAAPDLPTDGAAPAGTGAPTGPLDASKMPVLPALTPAATVPGAPAAKPLSASSLSALNATLTKSGLTLDTKALTDVKSLAAAVTAKSNTLDAQVTLAAASWVNDLGKLHAPTLKTPGTPSAPKASVPGGALVFGLFADKSLASLVSTSPDLVSAAQSSGVGSKALTATWNKTMLNTYNASKGDLAKFLPDACTGGMLAVMATGKAQKAQEFSSSCSPSCVTGGLYLNDQAASLFSGTKSTLPNPFAQVWGSSTLSQLNTWQKKQLLTQNPNLGTQITNDLKGSGSAMCSSAGAAAKSTLGSTLPGIFSTLTPKK